MRSSNRLSIKSWAVFFTAVRRSILRRLRTKSGSSIEVEISVTKRMSRLSLRRLTGSPAHCGRAAAITRRIQISHNNPHPAENLWDLRSPKCILGSAAAEMFCKSLKKGIRRASPCKPLTAGRTKRTITGRSKSQKAESSAKRFIDFLRSSFGRTTAVCRRRIG